MPDEELPAMPELPVAPVEKPDVSASPDRPKAPEAPKRSIAAEDKPVPRPERKTAPATAPRAPERTIVSGDAPAGAEGEPKSGERKEGTPEKGGLERDMEKKAAERGLAPEEKKSWWTEKVPITSNAAKGPKEPLSFGQRLWRGIKGGALMYPVGILTTVGMGIWGSLGKIAENVATYGTTYVPWAQWFGASLTHPITLGVVGAGFAAGFLTHWFRKRREQKK
ncbi:MAG TPA: hypothetical protein VD862_04575 [Candidatus Paceibacterota bacterium]|nr:hypothetical protein [Candidatus Paceibacterota bacterium]